MAKDKAVFKHLTCPVCRYHKTDATGKAKALCPKDGTELTHSENWYARIYPKGKKSFIKCCTPRRRDAEDYVLACKSADFTGALLPGQEKDITWEQAEKDCTLWWKAEVMKGDIVQGTADQYKTCMAGLRRFFNESTLLTITKGDVIDYQTCRAEMNKKAGTINNEVKTLKKIYSMHVERTDSVASPRLCGKFADISMVKSIPKDGHKVRFLDEREIEALLGCAATPRVKMAALVSLNTGLRRSNVLELTWDEVRLSRRVIELPAERMKSKRDFTVDIPASLVEQLKIWRSSTPLSKFVFPDCTGRTFRGEWDRTITDCEYSDKKGSVTFHTLRHTFASHFLMSEGGDLSTLSEMLDHSEISITKDIYGHLSREHKTKASDKFAVNFLDQFNG